MKLNQLVRLVFLSLAVTITALTTFAAPPTPPTCTCDYCPQVNPRQKCDFEGTTTTCGSFLAVTLCQPTS